MPMKSIVKSLMLAVILAFTAGNIAADAAGARKPIMVIRFDGNTQYQNGLSMMVRSVVEKKKNASFDVVAGAQAGYSARAVAEDIIRLGVPRSNVTLSGSGYNSNEVMIFVR